MMFFWIFIGAIGMGYFLYGKRTTRYSFLLSGIIMGIYPYVIHNWFAAIFLGVVLCVAPFYLNF